jgi:hypothetical protein
VRRDANGEVLIGREELRLRVYERFSTISPILAYKTTDDIEVILSFLSSFEWNIHGGPSKWEDRRELHSSNHIETLAGDRVLLGIEDVSTAKSKKAFRIECKAPKAGDKKEYFYSIIHSSFNEPDEKLPDPVKMFIETKVSCRNPSSIEIYIWKEGEKRLDVNNAQNAISESFTIRNNQHHDFQTWVYDSFKRPFYNFSSLNIKWSLTPESAGTLEPM